MSLNSEKLFSRHNLNEGNKNAMRYSIPTNTITIQVSTDRQQVKKTAKDKNNFDNWTAYIEEYLTEACSLSRVVRYGGDPLSVPVKWVRKKSLLQWNLQLGR